MFRHPVGDGSEDRAEARGSDRRRQGSSALELRVLSGSDVRDRDLEPVASVKQDWKIGWREHTFTQSDAFKLLVGFDVVCNWTDGTRGDSRKDSD